MWSSWPDRNWTVSLWPMVTVLPWPTCCPAPAVTTLLGFSPTWVSLTSHSATRLVSQLAWPGRYSLAQSETRLSWVRLHLQHPQQA